MKTITKFLGVIPVVALSACSVNKVLNKDQAINVAEDIIQQQNNGSASFEEYTYTGQFMKVIDTNEDVTEGVYVKLARSYETPYLYYSEVDRKNGEQVAKVNLWIYQTSGNVIIATSNTKTDENFYTAYPLTLENTFYDLLKATKDVTNIEHVEGLIYSQDVLKGVESLYNESQARQIYQAYSYQVSSKGNGNLNLLSNFSYQEDDQSYVIHEEYSFNKYLFSSLMHLTTVDYEDENGRYDSMTLKESESITYKVKKVYPDLNDFTFIENN